MLAILSVWLKNICRLHKFLFNMLLLHTVYYTGRVYVLVTFQRYS